MGCYQSSVEHKDENSTLNTLVHSQYTDKRSNNKYCKGKQYEAKVVLLGDSGVGKSSIALRFCQGRFLSHHEVTIGAAFLQQTLRLPDGVRMKLHIWDTGGQERFRAMAPLYYRDAHGAIIVYDINQPNTLESVKYWQSELKQNALTNCCIVIAANKCDISNDSRVSLKALDDFSDREETIYVQCSAKTGENILYVFEPLANRIYSNFQRNMFESR